MLFSPGFFNSVPLLDGPEEFTRRVRSPKEVKQMKGNENRIHALYTSAALLPLAADQTQHGIRAMRVHRISEIFVKVCNLMMLSAALNLLAKRVLFLSIFSSFAKCYHLIRN